MDPADLHELHGLAKAIEVGLSLGRFSKALVAVSERYLPSDSTYQQRISFYRKLHLQDFALAQSCALGYPAAWKRFLQRFSSRLYAAAMAISKNEQIARDLSDSLAGDLFAGKIASYSGRGSLEAWLKALLTHTYVDRFRSQRRVVSLDQNIEILKGLCVNPEEMRNTADPRLDLAIEAAFLDRPPDERFLLAAYFFDGWTLAQIANAVGIHESSASRRINQILHKLRKAIHQQLRKAGMSPAQIEESFDKEGWTSAVDIRGLLLRGLARE
jgi:RNA polymerase sigma-70 factor (ECF subfamily)